MALSKRTGKEKRKAPAHAFKEGNQAAKGFGRPKLTEEQKQLRLKTRAEFRAMLDSYLLLEMKELKRLLNAANTPALDKMVIKSIIICVETGDRTHLDWFLNHSLGKPKETQNLHVSGGMSNTSELDLSSLSKEELMTLAQIAEKTSGKKQ